MESIYILLVILHTNVYIPNISVFSCIVSVISYIPGPKRTLASCSIEKYE